MHEENSNFYLFVSSTICTLCSIHIELIEPCLEYFYGVLEKVKTFYLRAILPEVIGKWYSKQKVTPCNDTNSSPADTLLCNKFIRCSSTQCMLLKGKR